MGSELSVTIYSDFELPKQAAWTPWSHAPSKGGSDRERGDNSSRSKVNYLYNIIYKTGEGRPWPRSAHLGLVEATFPDNTKLRAPSRW